MKRTSRWIWCVAFSLLVSGSALGTFMLGGFDLSWFTIDGGGGMTAAGGDFELSGTIGQPDAGALSGGDFELTGGFWVDHRPAKRPAPGDEADDVAPQDAEPVTFPHP